VAGEESALDTHAALDERTHREIADFLSAEAGLLDQRQFEAWLELLADDLVYEMPIRVTRASGAESEFLPASAWLKENRASLAMRVQRLRSPGAWSEDPPSRTRHFVSNVRAEPGARPNEVAVTCNLLVYRSRGDTAQHELFSAERRDWLRKVDGRWQLARREIYLDQTVLGSQDLSIFF
jgi:3-phenylpropionate/cinnamic acid dioxygenase small subunit